MKTKNIENQVDELAALNYTIVLRQDDEGDIVASIKELEGCVAHGQDALEALASLESMKRLWIESCLRDGGNVPLPDIDEELPSGKWLQRAPRTLHRKLIEAATRDGVSLNTFVCTCLAEAIGNRVHVAPLASTGILNGLHGAAAIEPVGKWIFDRSTGDRKPAYQDALIAAMVAAGQPTIERGKREDQQPSRSFAYHS